MIEQAKNRNITPLHVPQIISNSNTKNHTSSIFIRCRMVDSILSDKFKQFDCDVTIQQALNDEHFIRRPKLASNIQ